MIRELDLRLFIIIMLIVIPMMMGCSDKEGVALSINSNDISLEEFDREYEIYKNEYIEQYGEDILKRETEDGILQEDLLKKEVLEKLAKEELILADILTRGIELTDEEFEKEFNDYKSKLGGEENYKNFLENKGLKEEEVESSIRKQALVDKYKREIITSMEVTEKEAREFFENNREDLIQIKASHILVLSKDEGEEILDKLKRGESFEQLALERSKDTLSAGVGGSLGYFTRSDFIKELVDVAFNLEIDEISDVVETEIGYHIIKVEDRKDDFESLKDHTISVLKEDKYTQEIEHMERNARVKVYIEGIPKLKYEKNNSGIVEKIKDLFN